MPRVVPALWIAVTLLQGMTPASAASVRPASADVSRHAIFQRVSWTEGQQQGELTSRGTMVTAKEIQGDTARYRIWVKGSLAADGGGSSKKMTSGAVVMDRNQRTEQVQFSTSGFDLIQLTINQVLAQVARGYRESGRWQETISLKLPVPAFPQEVKLRLDVQPIKLSAKQQALCIHSSIDRLSAPALQRGGLIAGELTGQYRCVLVYSPEQHQLYQAGSLFAAAHATGQLRIGTTSMAVDEQGTPLYPLLDLRSELGLAAAPRTTAHAGTLPLAVAQGLKLQQVAAALTMTTAERATNPAIPALLGDILFLDGAAGYFDASPLDKWCSAYGEAHGGEAGKLVAKYLLNVTTSGLGEALPATLAFPELIAPLATAYTLYQLYDSMAALGGAMLAAQVNKLQPFNWSRPTLSQAERLFPTDGITKTAPNWNGGAAGGQSVPASSGQFNHGPALRQLEQLAGRNIESVQVPTVKGQPVNTGSQPITGNATPPSSGSVQTPAQPVSQPDAMAPESGTTPELTETAPPASPASPNQLGPNVYTATPTTPSTPPPPSPASPNQLGPGVYTAEPAPVGQTGTETPNMIDGAQGQPVTGQGITVGKPDTPPPPNPTPHVVHSSGMSGGDAALVGLGVAGAAVAVAGVAAVAAAAANQRKCPDGYSLCLDGACCPSYNINGVLGAYHFPAGCFGSPSAAANYSAHTGLVPSPCADEGKSRNWEHIRGLLQSKGSSPQKR